MFDKTESRFPDPRKVPGDAPAAVGGELSPEWLLDAYARGYFPWYGEGQPVLWWSPEPRFVLEPESVRITRSLAKEARKACWSVTFDSAFEDVIRNCAKVARPGQDGTWIVDDMIQAYLKLHELGYAHSVECWREEKLVGGLYGISLGSVFFGESMFHLVSNASKVAFVRLVERLRGWHFTLIDCQQPTEYMTGFGAVGWTREQFLSELAIGLEAKTRRFNWGDDLSE